MCKKELINKQPTGSFNEKICKEMCVLTYASCVKTWLIGESVSHLVNIEPTGKVVYNKWTGLVGFGIKYKVKGTQDGSTS